MPYPDNAMKIQKQDIRDAALFALECIPQVNEPTLEGFIELLYASGDTHRVTVQEVVLKMQDILYYSPEACPRSLMVVADLVGISLSEEGILHRPLAAGRF